MYQSRTQIFPPDQQQDQVDINRVQQKKQPFLLGGIHINYILWVFLPSLILGCLYSYHMAVKQKQEKPFPHATITATACHFPQDIEFRFFFLGAGSFINIIYFVIFKWTKLLIKQTQFPFTMEGWVFPVAQASIIGFYCAIATIDGKGTTPIHGPGAVIFFIILFICVGYITFVLRQVRQWYSPSLSRFSINFKIALFLYIFANAIYSLSKLIKNQDENEDAPGVVIIQWNLTIGSMIWLLSFVLDWKDVFITLRGDFSRTVKMVAPDS